MKEFPSSGKNVAEDFPEKKNYFFFNKMNGKQNTLRCALWCWRQGQRLTLKRHRTPNSTLCLFLIKYLCDMIKYLRDDKNNCINWRMAKFTDWHDSVLNFCDKFICVHPLNMFDKKYLVPGILSSRIVIHKTLTFKS